ncbi:tannase and feruloyl esterase [Meredithblackwellia eburnea MCA 4105]
MKLSQLPLLSYFATIDHPSKCYNFHLAPSTTTKLAKLGLHNISLASHPSYHQKGSTLTFSSYNGDLNINNITTPFCRLELSLLPHLDSNSSTTTELWLPDTPNYNNKLLGVGNGGFSGGIVYPDLWHQGTQHGFAAFSTNTGHNSHPLDGSWALDNEELVTDFAWRAVHESTVLAKALTKLYYSSWSAPKTYWSGCSTGGAQGLKSAQMWPKDFDGILVGSPASDMTHLQPWALRQNQALEDGQFDKKTWLLVKKEVLKQCDALDGVVDGVIEDPRKCFFRPEALACRPKKKKNCLQPHQVEALKTLYTDYYDQDGKLFFHRSEPGGEDFYDSMTPSGFPKEYFRRFVLNDTEWDHKTLDQQTIQLAQDLDVGRMNAIDPNLVPFAKQKGKLIHYFGWGDQNIAPQDSIKYYNSVENHTRSTSKLDIESFYRLFPVPGMSHCRYGAGANGFGAASQTASGQPPLDPKSPKHNMLLALVQWVEKGKAPDEIVATKWKDDNAAKGLLRTRKLCAFPKRSVVIGPTRSDRAEDFNCVDPSVAV